MDWFEHIIPCGIVGKDATSFTEELGTETTVQDVQPVLLQAFSAEFDCEITEVKDIDQNVLKKCASIHTPSS